MDKKSERTFIEIFQAALVKLEADWRTADPANEDRFWQIEQALNPAGRQAKAQALVDFLEAMMPDDQLLMAFYLLKRPGWTGPGLAAAETQQENIVRERMMSLAQSHEAQWLTRN